MRFLIVITSKKRYELERKEARIMCMSKMLQKISNQTILSESTRMHFPFNLKRPDVSVLHHKTQNYMMWYDELWCDTMRRGTSRRTCVLITWLTKLQTCKSCDVMLSDVMLMSSSSFVPISFPLFKLPIFLLTTFSISFPSDCNSAGLTFKISVGD